MSKPKKKSKGKPESKPEPTMIDRRRELLVLGHLLKRQGKIPYVIEAALFAQNQTWGSPLSEFDMLTISREISRPAKARKHPKPSDSDGSVMQHTAKHGREIANNEVEIGKEETAANAEQSRKELHEMLLKVPVSPVQLVSDLEAYFAKYLSLPPEAALILSLWAMNTHVFKAFKTVPYLNVRSATPSCGKSTVFELLEEVVARPYSTVNETIAVIFRRIDISSPTLLMDESEFLQGRDNRAREFRGILNAGYKKGGTVGRLLYGEEQRFNVYCPKAFASIKGISTGTPLFDRSITLHMQPAPGAVLEFKKDKELQLTSDLRMRLEAYAVQNESKLLRIQDETDQSWLEIKRRDRELWGPLLMHARLAGSNIETRMENLAKQFCQDKHSVQSQDDPTTALAREIVFALKKVTIFEFTSSELVKLVKNEENWGEALAGKNVQAQAGFAGRFLRNYRPETRLLDGKTRYQRKDVLAKLEAHLPSLSPLESTVHLSGSGEVDSSGLPEERVG